MKTFEQAARLQFENEMAAHSKDFAPNLCKLIGDDQLRAAVRSAITKAAGHGFTYRGPIRLFIEMTLLCGSSFDEDPVYQTFGEILRSPADQMLRAQQIHEDFPNSLEEIAGAGAAGVQKYLKGLLSTPPTPLDLSNGFTARMLWELNWILPQKAAYAGEAGLNALVDAALSEARQYQFQTDRAGALLVLLKFAFGHGCTSDPLYPWISGTLMNDRITDASAKAALLQNEAIAWLERLGALNRQRSA